MKHTIKSDTTSISKAIDQYIVGSKAHRNREILKSRYIDGYTFEEIAEMYDMSVRHIKKICYDNEPILLAKLRAEE